MKLMCFESFKSVPITSTSYIVVSHEFDIFRKFGISNDFDVF